MGQTISDRNRQRYFHYRGFGMSHEEALDQWPEPYHERLEADLRKSDIESHFGMKDKWFWLIIALTPVAAIILAIILK